MKRLILFTVLLTMIAPLVVLSQEPPPVQPQGLERQQRQLQMRERELDLNAREMEQREREMELQQRQVEIDFQREMQKIELENAGKLQKDKLQPLLLLVLIVHILCAVWVYQDIRKQAYGSGIWIVIALLTGLLGTLVYAIVRLGEKPKIKA